MAITSTDLTAGATQTARAAQSGGASAIASDFDTFLLMLTTQLQNQDPMDPMKTEEFAVQLATFASVEQQVRTNDLLATMAGVEIASLAGLIGMEARAPVATWVDANPVTVYPGIADGADAADLIVRDAAGTIVDRRPIDTDAAEVTWNGSRADGTQLPAGFYGFQVESRRGEDVLDTVPAETWGTISEATLVDGVQTLVFADGTARQADQVTAVRAPVREE